MCIREGERGERERRGREREIGYRIIMTVCVFVRERKWEREGRWGIEWE